MMDLDCEEMAGSSGLHEQQQIQPRPYARFLFPLGVERLLNSSGPGQKEKEFIKTPPFYF